MSIANCAEYAVKANHRFNSCQICRASQAVQFAKLIAPYDSSHSARLRFTSYTPIYTMPSLLTQAVNRRFRPPRRARDGSCSVPCNPRVPDRRETPLEKATARRRKTRCALASRSSDRLRLKTLPTASRTARLHGQFVLISGAVY